MYFQASYTFPFGLKIGGIYDTSKWEMVANTTAATAPAVPIPGLKTTLKRNVWAVPLSYNIGPHTAFFTYAKADKLKGDIGGASFTGDDTGARFMSIGYQFALSKRTNIHLNYSEIKNQQFAGYDFFSNTVGMANGNFGADPKIYSIGVRHAF
jgi:predicted porin